MATNRIEVYRDAAGEWRWRYRVANGRVLADSGEGYTERQAAAWAAMAVFDVTVHRYLEEVTRVLTESGMTPSAVANTVHEMPQTPFLRRGRVWRAHYLFEARFTHRAHDLELVERDA